MSINAQVKELKNEIMKIASAHGVITICIFGSVARKEDSNLSDVDFLVDFEEGRSLFDLIRLKQDLESLLARPVDVLTSNAIHHRIKEHILNEAVQL